MCLLSPRVCVFVLMRRVCCCCCLCVCSNKVAGPMLSGLPSGPAPTSPASTYTGGYLAAISPGAEPTIAVAYEAKGGLSDIKATATAAGASWLLGVDGLFGICSRRRRERRREKCSCLGCCCVHESCVGVSTCLVDICRMQWLREVIRFAVLLCCLLLTLFCLIPCHFCNPHPFTGLLAVSTTVVKALLGAGTREAVPYQHKDADGPLTSVTPLVQVRGSGRWYAVSGVASANASVTYSFFLLFLCAIDCRCNLSYTPFWLLTDVLSVHLLPRTTNTTLYPTSTPQCRCTSPPAWLE